MEPLHRRLVPAAIAVAAGALALPALPALAQTPNASTGSTFTNLVPVIIWTVVIALLAMSVLSVGYLYRRKTGQTVQYPNPDMTEPGHADPRRDAAGQPVPEHVLEEHAAGQHDDATEQAEQLYARERSKSH